MKPTQPYQPLLLRLFHGITGLCLIASLITAFWTYNTYDSRWGRLPLPDVESMEGIHGTVGLWTLLIFPVFVIYACRAGQRRLIQADSLSKLSRVGQPIWWYTLNRIFNTLALTALTFALFSGKMMDETWLPNGELNHGWYYAHLISWGIMVGAIALHLLFNVKVGGVPLLLSMMRWGYRESDSPAHWKQSVVQWWGRYWNAPWLGWWQSRSMLIGLESAILSIILLSWIISIAKGMS
jgi:hypothetical protein